MSIDREKPPARLDSQETRVNVEETFQHGEGGVQEGFPGFSFNQASLPDNGHNPPPRRSVQTHRTPNLKGSTTPIPASCYELRFGEVPWQCGDPHRYGPPNPGDSWRKCHELTEKYDNDMCEAWKDEVDKLLIFAGLFSATVTAFTVEAYKWLRVDNSDTSVRLLAFIASQIGNSSTSSSSLPSEINPPPFSVSSSEVRISAAWFLSLTLALSTVLIGILCLQWLREYQRDAALPHKESIALRQMRYEGLLAWHVPEILSALPVMLQAALLLFFVGVLDLLWSRNTIVAACISAVVGLVLIFLIITTALPALQHTFVANKHLRVHQCPYKSPQSWLAYRLGHGMFWLFNSLNLPWWRESPGFHRLVKSVADLNWLTFDMRWRQLRDAEEVVRGTAKKPRDSEDIIHGLQWVNDTFTQSVDAVYPVYHCISELELSAAAHTVSGFYLDGLIDNTTLRVMMDDRFSPTEDQKRDILSSYYLHLHQDRHPVLKLSYVESLLRILNSQEVPRPFYDWLSEVLQEVASRLPALDSDAPFSLLTSDIVVQVLLCTKSLMKREHRDAIRIMDLVIAWALLHHLLSPTLLYISSDEQGEEGGGMNVINLAHLQLACGMFEEFESWMTRGREIERFDRVKLCAEGMITVFAPSSSVNVAWLRVICPEIVKASSLIQALSVRMTTLGGPSVVLSREKRWWLEYWDAYTAKDWDNLVENFGKIEDVDEF